MKPSYFRTSQQYGCEIQPNPHYILNQHPSNHHGWYYLALQEQDVLQTIRQASDKRKLFLTVLRACKGIEWRVQQDDSTRSSRRWWIRMKWIVLRNFLRPYSYKTTVSIATQATSYSMVFGGEVVLPLKNRSFVIKSGRPCSIKEWGKSQHAPHKVRSSLWW